MKRCGYSPPLRVCDCVCVGGCRCVRLPPDGLRPRSYEVLRQLGSGNFSDVFLVRGRTPAQSPVAGAASPPSASSPGQLFAVKKTKTLLRSRADRDSQLQEIKVYEHLSRCADAMRDGAAGGEAAKHIASGFRRVVEYFAAWQEEGYLHIKMEVRGVVWRGVVRYLPACPPVRLPSCLPAFLRAACGCRPCVPCALYCAVLCSITSAPPPHHITQSHQICLLYTSPSPRDRG